MAENDERIWHPNFEEYIEKMVSHPNYRGLYYEKTDDGRVKWVVTGKSEDGQKRQTWWDEQCRKYGIPIEKGCYAKVARLIHPTGRHVCQCCGDEHSIYYEYPTKNTVSILNEILGTKIDKDKDEERADCTIREIIEVWCNTNDKIIQIAKAFKLPEPTSKDHLIELIYKELVDNCSKLFSPGVMSNSPDRFDGFHSYALCCRTTFDTGRFPENLLTYTQDRRAYEGWADGDFNLANRLMGEFRKQLPMTCPQCGKMAKMTADHIGPISLGFCHSTNFAPLCRSCNSAKNNRFTKLDVETLLALENNGNVVVSWHSKVIWDTLKLEVKNDEDAKKLSSVMLSCHQNVLKLFARIYEATGEEYLSRFLHPDYAYNDYRFENFDPLHLEKLIIRSKELDSANKRKNAQRYMRIAFESLEEFNGKDNRKTTFVVDQFEPTVQKLIGLIKANSYQKADDLLNDLIRVISMNIKKNIWG